MDNQQKRPRADMRLASYLPNPAAIFVRPDYTLDDVRELQKNPAYLAAVQALRAEAVRAALEGRPESIGLQSALNVLGMVEYEAQLETSIDIADEDDPPGINADEIGFEDVRVSRK